ncbi:MAG: hypothetical protein OEY34_08725 [Cyclobacteriaceae bacterium]|nr:hypothetical protein [Cyclobacteriaceae bacterium]
MKKIITAVIFISSILVYNESHSQFKLPEVFSVRNVEIVNVVAEILYANSVKEYAELETQYLPGVKRFLMKGERGVRTGKYVFVYTFDHRYTRNYYFPTPDAESYPKYTAQISESMQNIGSSEYLEGKVKVDDEYTDYVILNYAEMINPQLGEVIAMRFFEIPEKKQKKFEEFTKQIHDAFQKNVEGYYIYIGKGDRGERTGKYVMITAIDTYDRRNAYFPETEVLSEQYNEALKKVDDIISTMNSFLGEQDMEFTDYLVIK